jgi:hypothetical protein
MPRKIRQLLQDYRKAGFEIQLDAGTGRFKERIKPATNMNPIDLDPQTIVWSEEDQLYVGYCPSLFHGGSCHGKDPVEVLRELREIIAGELAECAEKGMPPPPGSTLQLPVTVGSLTGA